MYNTSLIFDGFDISTISGFSVFDYNANNLPTRDFKTFKLARQNRSVTTTADYSIKSIPVFGIIKDCTRESAEETLAAVREKLQGVNKILQAPQYNRNIQYRDTTLSSMTETFIANNMSVVMLFTASDPIGIDTVTQDLIDPGDQNTTVSPTSYSMTFEGSAPNQAPIITITVNSVTDGTAESIELLNVVTGAKLTVTRDWVNGDVLVVDTFDSQVTLNGIAVFYTGRIPLFQAGAQTLRYSDTFTARDVDVEAEYNARFV